MNPRLLLALSALALTPCFAQDAPPPPDPYRIADTQKAHFDLMHVPAAWAITRGSPDCLIGVIDTGFDFFHPALADTLRPGYAASEVYHTTSASLIGHGTLVTSLMVARSAGDDGMVGFAPDCAAIGAAIGMPKHRLLLLQQAFRKEHPEATMADWQAEMRKHADVLRAFGPEWLGYVTRTTAEAIVYLTDRGVKVINISAYMLKEILAQAPEGAAKLDAAFAYAIEHDVLIVIGAGNNAVEVQDYPGTSETVLVAGACTLTDERWEATVEAMGAQITQGSCYGPRLSVMAPTDNLRIAVPHDEASYQFADTPMGAEDMPFAGPYEVTDNGATSSAAPIVASLAALVRSLRPDLKVPDVIAIIQESATDIGDEGPDPMTGHGRVDFLAALELAKTWEAKTGNSSHSLGTDSVWVLTGAKRSLSVGFESRGHGDASDPGACGSAEDDQQAGRVDREASGGTRVGSEADREA